MTDILVLYYSLHGSTANLAREVAHGINSIDGCNARLRTVPAVSSKTEATEPKVPDEGAPYATTADLGECATDVGPVRPVMQCGVGDAGLCVKAASIVSERPVIQVAINQRFSAGYLAFD